ncbi:MAG: phosphoglycerate dehydrogenase [bacterium]|nr:phosphoglycerate dehydrogenase [bacterium]
MKVLVSPSSCGQCGSDPYDLLEENNYEIVKNPYGRKLTEEEVIELGKECVGIVAGVEPLNKNVMDALANLKCISRVGVGMDSVDLEYAAQKGIAVKNTPDGPTRAVAELTVGLVFDILRNISKADGNIKKGTWKKEIGNLLLDKKIGIYGLGRIGKLTASIFRAMGNPVIAYDIARDEEWLKANSVEMVEKDVLFKEADIITIHVPKSPEGPVVGEKELAAMKPEAYLVNVARGGVVDEGALYNILKENKIAGAAIDVFEKEPYAGPLTDLQNVVLTPHLGSYAKEGKLKMEVDAVKNLIEVLKA